KRPAAPGDHRPDGEDGARRRALGVGLPPQDLRAAARLGAARQAERDHAQHHEVRARRSRAAPGETRGMEPAGGVASRPEPGGAALVLASAPAYVSYRRRERMAARPAGGAA